MCQSTIQFTFNRQRTLESVGACMVSVCKLTFDTEQTTLAVRITTVGIMLTPILALKGMSGGSIATRNFPTSTCGCIFCIWVFCLDGWSVNAAVGRAGLEASGFGGTFACCSSIAFICIPLSSVKQAMMTETELDASFAVNNDMCSHTHPCIINKTENKLKELVGVNDLMGQVLRMCLFLEAQVHVVNSNIIFQDNRSAILFAENVKGSSS